MLLRWGFLGTISNFYEQLDQASLEGGPKLETFLSHLRQSLCVTHGEDHSERYAIPNEISKKLVAILLRANTACLLLHVLYVLDIAFTGDRSIENLLFTPEVLNLMDMVLESSLGQVSPFAITDCLPVLSMAIHLISSPQKAYVMYSGPFYRRCMTSFLDPGTEESYPQLAIRVVKLVTKVFILQDESFAVPNEDVNGTIAKFVSVLSCNSAHNGLTGALLKFFTRYLNFDPSLALIRFVELDVFRAVSVLISKGFFDTPICWVLFSDACFHARTCDSNQDIIKAHLEQVIDFRDAWEDITPGMDAIDGNCCKGELNILCLLYQYTVLFHEVPSVIPPDEFMSSAEVILEDARAESVEMIIILMAEVLRYATHEFVVQVQDMGILASIVNRVIRGTNEPAIKAALDILDIYATKKLLDEEVNTEEENSAEQESGVVTFLRETIRMGGELGERATQILVQCSVIAD
jgi:hypothetical protein